MKHLVALFALLLLIGGGCANTQELPVNPNADADAITAEEDAELAEAEALLEELKAELEEAKKDLQEEPAPVIGGTERDGYGVREECIINGDCDLGYTCKEGVCAEADY